MGEQELQERCKFSSHGERASLGQATSPWEFQLSWGEEQREPLFSTSATEMCGSTILRCPNGTTSDVPNLQIQHTSNSEALSVVKKNNIKLNGKLLH